MRIPEAWIYLDEDATAKRVSALSSRISEILELEQSRPSHWISLKGQIITLHWCRDLRLSL
jgi:hypothetical protein